MNKKKIMLIGLLSVLFVIIVWGFSYLLRYNQYVNKIKDITIVSVDLKSIEDGEYIGECDVDFISAKVKVIIESHEIKAIEIIHHQNDRGDAANAILDQIIAQQRIDVDAISGVTNSSRVIQKAIQNALK